MQFCASCGDPTSEQPCTSCGADPSLDGRYALRELLGQGSHGMTWRADGPDGVVAVKVINLGHGLQGDAQHALDREVAVLRQLSHPQIPALLDDFSTRSGMTRYRCIVQEFIDGNHLLDELDMARHTPAQVMEAVAEVADILTHLHGKTPPIIHRDIKPQNIIRRRDGSLTLIDFGSVRDTLVGTLGGTMSVGTVGYMAPEQITGDVQPASDIFALGALAAHLLTRQPPKLTHNPDDPVRWRKPPGLPDLVGALVDSMLHPDPAQRPESAAVVARQARRLAETPGRPLPPEPPPPPPGPLGGDEDEWAVSLADDGTDEIMKQLRLPMRRLVVGYGLLALLAVIAPVAALVEIESIIGTGAAGAVLGILVALMAGRRKQVVGTIVSAAAPVFSLFCFLLITITSMSPAQAEGPIPILLGAFAVVFIPALLGASGMALSSEQRAALEQTTPTPRRLSRAAQQLPRLKRAEGSRREREELKETASQWRAGIVPEAHHRCPFCGTAVRPDNLIIHYDKVHLPEASQRRRQKLSL